MEKRKEQTVRERAVEGAGTFCQSTEILRLAFRASVLHLEPVPQQGALSPAAATAQKHSEVPLVFCQHFAFPEMAKIIMKALVDTQRNSCIAVQMYQCRMMQIIPVRPGGSIQPRGGVRTGMLGAVGSCLVGSTSTERQARNEPPNPELEAKLVKNKDGNTYTIELN